MSFVKNIFQKMSASDHKDEELEDDDVSGSDDTETEESTDTGIATSGSDLDSSARLEVADCSAISNFFGYW